METIKVFITFLTLVNNVYCQITFKINFNETISEDLNFLTLTDHSLQQCVEQCAERSHCQALRYRRRFHLCGLYTEYIPTSATADSVTVRRDDMQIPSTFEVCDVDDMNCAKKECRPPAALVNGKYLGNMNQIGSKKAILCDRGYAEVGNISTVICGNDGYWNYTPTCEVSQSMLSDLAARTLFFTNPVTHSAAVAACTDYKANLVKIDQRWKMDYIVKLIQNNQTYESTQFWIDGSNANANNYSASDALRFHDNTVMPMDAYYWVPEKPDKPEITHCVRITREHHFDDCPCYSNFGYICEE